MVQASKDSNNKSWAKFSPTYEDYGLVGTYIDEMTPFIGITQLHKFHLKHSLMIYQYDLNTNLKNIIQLELSPNN